MLVSVKDVIADEKNRPGIDNHLFKINLSALIGIGIKSGVIRYD